MVKNAISNYDRNIILHNFEANVLLYHIVSKPQFLNFRLMPHLVVGGHTSLGSMAPFDFKK